ncbi:MAG: flagellin [Lachnotalea sp.]
MIIANNLIAMNANANMKANDKRLRSSTEKLASGYRINRSADSPAGLQISETMRKQIRGLDQASSNIQDGISYVQVADSGLGDVQDILIRLRQLSVKSANDTNSEVDRQAIDDETQALKKQISHIFSDTEFNTKKIWDNNPENQVQIGTEQVVAVKSNQQITSGVLNNTNKASIPSNLSYQLNADVNGITVTWDAYNGSSYTSDLIGWPTEVNGSHSFQLSDYLDTTTYPELVGLDFKYTYNVDDAATLTDVIDSLNGVGVSCYPYNNVNAIGYSEDGNALTGISFISSINYTALLGSGKDLNAYDDLFIEGSVSNVLTTDNLINDPTDSDSSSEWVFEFEMPNIGTVKATASSTSYYSTWKDPDQNWWGTTIYGPYTKIFSPTPNDGSLDSVNASLENSGLDLVNDTITGGRINVSFNLTSDSAYTLDNGDSTTSVGSITMSIDVSSTDTIDSITNNLKNLSGVDIDAGNQLTNASSHTYYNTYSNGAKSVMIDSPIYESRMCLNIQSGANTNNCIAIEYRSLNSNNLGVNTVSTLTRDDADTAIETLDQALSIVSEARSTFGAYQNELEHARANVDNEEENVAGAESRIRDTDMTSEMVNYSKGKILQQVNQSILAQANIIGQRALDILK